MQLIPASNRDLAEFRHGFFPFRKTDPTLCWPQRGRSEAKIQGLALRSSEDVLLGITLYEISSDLLLVSEFTSFPLSLRAGQMMAAGLRKVAAKNKLDLIWFTDDQGRFTESFVAQSGFELMAFYEHGSGGAGRTNHWRLPRADACVSTSANTSSSTTSTSTSTSVDADAMATG